MYQNTNLLVELFAREFNVQDQTVAVQAAIDNMIYQLTPESERAKLKNLKSEYLLGGIATLESHVTIEQSRFIGVLSNYEALKSSDSYEHAKTLLERLTFLLNKITDRYIGVHQAVYDFSDLRYQISDIEKRMADELKSKNSMLVSMDGTVEKVYEIWGQNNELLSLGTAQYCGKESAYSFSEALEKFIKDRDPQDFTIKGDKLLYRGLTLYPSKAEACVINI